MNINPLGRPTVTAIALFGALTTAHAGQRSLAEVAPPDSLFYVSIDVERAATQWQTIDLVRLYGDAEVQAFIAPIVESITNESEFKQLMAVKFLLEQYGLPDIIDGKVEIAAVGYRVSFRALDSQQTNEPTWHRGSDPLPDEFFGEGVTNVDPELALVIDTAGQESFGASWDRVLELDPSIELSQGETGGAPWTQARIPAGLLGNPTPMSIYFTFVDDLFVAAMRDVRLVEIANALRGDAPQASLATEDGFQRFRTHSVRGTEIVETWLAGGPLMSKIIAAEKEGEAADAKSALEVLGLDKVAGLGMTLGLAEGRICDSIAFVLPKDRTGLLRIADSLQPGAKIVESVKKDAAAHIQLRADVARVYDIVLEAVGELDPDARAATDQEMASATEFLGFDVRNDLIASLGSDVLISVALPKSGFIPEVTGWVELKDTEKFVKVLDSLKKLLVEQTGGRMEITDLPLKDGDPGFYLKSNDLAGVAPSFALRNGKLLFSLSTSSLKRLTLAVAKPPVEGATLPEDLARSLRTTVGEDVGAIAGMFYVDLAASATMGLATAEPFLPALFQSSPIELDATQFPGPDTIASYLSGMLYTLRFSHDVVSIDGSSPFGGFSLFLGAGAGAASMQMQQRARFDNSTRTAQPDQPYIGVTLDPDATGLGGILVTGISPGTPAATAGILVDDIITMVSGRAVATPGELTAALSAAGNGSTVDITIERDGEIRTLKVFVGRRGDFIR